MNSSNSIPDCRILVVDDNLEIHRDFRKILAPAAQGSEALAKAELELFGTTTGKVSSRRFEIDSAYQGQEGLALLERALAEKRPYALAFVDVRMPPGWDGIETIGHFWKICPDLQVVICTAYSDYSWQEILEQLGESDNLVVLKKPFDNVEVLQLTHALTKKWVLGLESRNKLQDLDRLVVQRTQELESANEKLRKEVLERTQAEHALRASEERFQKAFTSSPMAMAIVTVRSQTYLEVNDSCLRMFGYTREEVLGRSREDLNIYVEPTKGKEVLRRVVSEKSVRDFPSQMRTRLGQTREILVSAELLVLEAEPCVLFLLNDVTDRRNLENQLRQSQKMEAVGQLASGLAHDFNNLLTIIQGHIALRLSDGLQPDVKQSLQEVGNAADRAAGLTRQLLAFSRKQVIQPRVLNLNPMLQNLSRMLQRLLGESIELACNLADTLPNVRADICNLEQVIINLAVNARDAMADGGKLTISTSTVEVDAAWREHNSEARPGQHVCLAAADTGCGMDAVVQSHIFEPFFTTKDVGKGSGLGLSTVHGIVKQHEGWIEVTSSPGEGSTFRIYLPVCGDPVEDPEKPAPALPDSECSATILVVEDEPVLRQLTSTVLSTNGYRVFEASNGVEALDVWQEHKNRIDLLLTDLVMPEGISGRRLAKQLKEQKPSLRTLYISGYSPETAETAFFQRHPLHFLQKPFKPNVLLHSVADCLRLDPILG